MVERNFTGFIARIFQHEEDHLRGLVFLDRLESARDVITEKEYQKLIASTTAPCAACAMNAWSSFVRGAPSAGLDVTFGSGTVYRLEMQVKEIGEGAHERVVVPQRLRGLFARSLHGQLEVPEHPARIPAPAPERPGYERTESQGKWM